VLVAGGGAIGYFGRSWSFFYDEWGTIFYRRSGGFSSFFAPHNGHLQALVIAIYRGLFATVGLRSYHPYQAVMIVAHLTLVALVYVYARPRIGRLVAGLVALPLLLLAYAWQVIFWTINLGFVFPLIALVVVLLRPTPLLIGVGVTAALASSSLGIAVAAGALVVAIASPDRVRCAAAWGLPVGCYLLWWLAYRPSALPPAPLRQLPGASPTGDVGFTSIHLSSPVRTLEYVAHLAREAAAALIGTQTAGWWAIGIIAIVVLGAWGARRTLTVATASITIAVLVFWLELAVTRAQYVQPESSAASRYLYPGAVLLALLLIETGRGIRLPRAAMALAVAAVGVVVAADLRTMRRFSGYFGTAFAQQSALLRRAQCDPWLPAGLSLDPGQAPGVTVGPYLAAVHALGSPPAQSCASASARRPGTDTERGD
jgi:hypothetical protein